MWIARKHCKFRQSFGCFQGSTVRHPVITKSCPTMSEFGRVTVTTKLDQLSFLVRTTRLWQERGSNPRPQAQWVRWLYHCATVPKQNKKINQILMKTFGDVVVVVQHENRLKSRRIIHLWFLYQVCTQICQNFR